MWTEGTWRPGPPDEAIDEIHAIIEFAYFSRRSRIGKISMKLCRKERSRGSLCRRKGKAESTGWKSAMTREESSHV